MKTTQQHISTRSLGTTGTGCAAMFGGFGYLSQFLAEHPTVESGFGESPLFAKRSRPVSTDWCDRLIPGNPASLLG